MHGPEWYPALPFSDEVFAPHLQRRARALRDTIVFCHQHTHKHKEPGVVTKNLGPSVGPTSVFILSGTFTGNRRSNGSSLDFNVP